MEAVATKLWEYMAIGLPVVVSDLPGQSRVVSQIHADLVCPTPVEAADVIRRLADDPELRRTLGEQARRLVEEKWEASRPDRVVQSLLEP
jgi:glycosyltransferase involved in cell wall biosynthesis